MFRNQASKEALSTANGHSHRSTGIASGLEYRDGYAVGGRVTTPKRGLVDGPGGYAGLEDMKGANPLENINPDVGTGSGLSSNVLMTEADRIAKMLSSDIPGMDTANLAIDYDKYATDYSKYKPSVSEVIGGAAADVIGQPIPAEQSQTATFFARLADRSGNLAATRKELDRLSEEDKNRLGLLSETEKQKLEMADRASKREDAKAQQQMTMDIFGSLLDKDTTEKELNARINMANNDVNARLEIAGLESETRLKVQEMINSKQPEKLLIFETLQKPQSEGGMGLDSDAAFATAFGTKDDQLQFAATILSAFSAAAIPGSDNTAANITKTIEIVNGLFPGTFSITEAELSELIAGTGDGSSFEQTGSLE